MSSKSKYFFKNFIQAQRFLAPLSLILLLSSCFEDQKFREEMIFAGKKHVSAKTLNNGYEVYQSYCTSCHGDAGKGNGVAAKGLIPPPRDFTQGLFKFGDQMAGGLPDDKALKKIIKEGLDGTAMLPWDIGDGQLEAVVQYIKTFAPDIWVGDDKVLGDKVKLTPDPYGEAHKAEALAKGKEIYHIIGSCQLCHQAYATKSELDQMSMKINKTPYEDFTSDIYELKNQDSEYNVKTLPPDFTWHELRSVNTVEEFYIRIGAGIGGTAMPSWKGTLEEDELWAVSYYVKELADLKARPQARMELIKKLKEQN